MTDPGGGGGSRGPNPLAASTPYHNIPRTAQRLTPGMLGSNQAIDTGSSEVRAAVIGLKIEGQVKHQYDLLIRQVKNTVAAAGIKAQFVAKENQLIPLLSFFMATRDRNALHESPLATKDYLIVSLSNIIATADKRIMCRTIFYPDGLVFDLTRVVTVKGRDPISSDTIDLGSYAGVIKPANHRIMEKCLKNLSVTARIPIGALTWQRPDKSEVATLFKHNMDITFMTPVKASEWLVFKQTEQPQGLTEFLRIYSDQDETQDEAQRHTLQQVLAQEFHTSQTLPELTVGALRLLKLQTIDMPLRPILALTAAAVPRCLEAHSLAKRLLPLWMRLRPQVLVDAAPQSGLPLKDFVTLIHLSKGLSQGFDQAQRAFEFAESSQVLQNMSLGGSMFQAADSSTDRPGSPLVRLALEMVSDLRFERDVEESSENGSWDREDESWHKEREAEAPVSQTALYTTAVEPGEDDTFLPDSVPVPPGTRPFDPTWLHLRYGKGAAEFPPIWLDFALKMKEAGQYTRYMDSMAGIGRMQPTPMRAVIGFLWSAVEQLQNCLDQNKVREWSNVTPDQEAVSPGDDSQGNREPSAVAPPPPLADLALQTIPLPPAGFTASGPLDTVVARPSPGGRGRARVPGSSPSVGRQAQIPKELDQAANTGRQVTFQSNVDNTDTDIYSDDQ